MDELLQIMFNNAIERLVSVDHSNIVNDVAERNLCGRMSIYLEDELIENNLDEYYADVEYNRMREGEIKVIIDHKHRIVPVCCDLIVHSRGELADDNLIAIEMKKSTGSEPAKRKDRYRLRALSMHNF